MSVGGGSAVGENAAATNGGRKRVLVMLLAVGCVALLVFPFVSPSLFYVSLLIEVFIFGVYAMSYDLLMGYTGIVSFGQALFFGTGAYTAGLLLIHTRLPFVAVLVAVIGVSAILAAIIGVLSLRVKGVYFTMVTLAFAELFHVVVQKLDKITGGADGLPGVPSPGILGNRTYFYYFALGFAVAVFLAVRRIVASPTGKVFMAIRENETRAEMIGYHVFVYKLIAMMVSGVMAGLAGAVYGVFLNYAYPNLLSADTTISALLMTIIGGVGTLYGPILGAGVVRVLGFVLSSYFERWVIFIGLIYVVIVMFLPYGIVGTWRDRVARRVQTGLGLDARGTGIGAGH